MAYETQWASSREFGVSLFVRVFVVSSEYGSQGTGAHNWYV